MSNTCCTNCAPVYQWYGIEYILYSMNTEQPIYINCKVQFFWNNCWLIISYLWPEKSGTVIWAMPERKRFFLFDVFPYLVGNLLFVVRREGWRRWRSWAKMPWRNFSNSRIEDSKAAISFYPGIHPLPNRTPNSNKILWIHICKRCS